MTYSKVLFQCSPVFSDCLTILNQLQMLCILYDIRCLYGELETMWGKWGHGLF